ncbi:HNH endonuclease [Paracoccus liaowanqingii]|uniref:HNH endonuclease n=1 Tax=Paracoccus liaowanqingii TaxID=2560053 RepID=A0A4Z1CSL2_9RHOB|nr:HNH endonuclease signature motif containing protein [Paracoccus liaowanqingii]TGN68273.1 HNH endonuclease [Paracoccus liaowanqingii]
MTWGFSEGATYNRRNDIHQRFQGQQQGGIITPANRQFPIVIITGEEGGAHGYADRLRSDGVFEYFGEGQVGDMRMMKGNAAIKDHAADGRDLLLFRKMRDGLRFLGQFVVEAYHTEQAPDREGQQRDAIVFELRPIDAVQSAEEDTIIPPGAELGDLRQRALEAAQAVPSTGVVISTVFERSRSVCRYVFARAQGVCEHCQSDAPFSRVNGTPYLEAHHIRRLTDGGPDDPRSMIALCPNCHRRAHSSADRSEVNRAMQAEVDRIEAAIL